jgi:RuvB-like protein 1 (pontin 52)
MLDIECFTYLNRALESSISPIVILASNRGHAVIRGTDDISAAHGIPPDLLARLLIVPTQPYAADEIKTIIRLRAKIEGLSITEPALNKVAEHGSKVSLRYALQLLTPASILARVNGRPAGIEEADVAECEDLFLDAKRSAIIVDRDSDQFLL